MLLPTSPLQASVYPVEVLFAGIVSYAALSQCQHEVSCLEDHALTTSRAGETLAGVAIVRSERSPIPYRWTWYGPASGHVATEIGNHPERYGLVKSFMVPEESGTWTLQFEPAGRDLMYLTVEIR